MPSPIRILVVGCGHMGTSHARAYHASPDFEICGLVSRGETSRKRLAADLGGDIPDFSDYHQALEATSPDAVCISTYPDTHASYALAALEVGCHVFLEKPLATTVADAQAILDTAKQKNLKVAIGYILQQHPAWNAFVEEARQLGKPLVMRMNLNQQSAGKDWQSHKNIMRSMSPIVDCGVHYVEIMCRMTQSRPVQVQAIGARLTDEIASDTYNYGQLQILFADGSVGWYEAGWGPMVSQTAFFIKDVFGPKGSVSIVASGDTLKDSADVNAHTRTDALRIHSASLRSDGSFLHEDRTVTTTDEPDHDGLCALEQQFFLDAIRNQRDLTEHWASALESLKIVLAADLSIRTKKPVPLE